MIQEVNMARRLKGVEYVPAEPFTRWLNERYEYHCRMLDVFFDPGTKHHNGPAVTALMDELGWSGHSGQRRLYRYRHMRAESRKGKSRKHRTTGINVVRPATEWRRDVVEEALHYAGVRFSDIYPEIAAAEDLPLEPAALCWTCNDLVHTIDGVCPWCEAVLRYPDEEEAA